VLLNCDNLTFGVKMLFGSCIVATGYGSQSRILNCLEAGDVGGRGDRRPGWAGILNYRATDGFVCLQ
jgi:hypothetical protein